MEAQQQNEDGSKSNGAFMCSRQTSTRWTPTSDQIRILKDLYYNNGVRSPSAEQIQRISARLRHYGKIEGKNVFYWFQNHKARERQKKRLTPTPTPTTTDHIHIQKSVVNGGWRSDQDLIYNKYPNITHGVPSSSSATSPGVFAVGQLGSYGYGSVAMEKSFRDCSISPRDGSGGNRGHNFGWVGVDPYSHPPNPFLEKKKLSNHHQILEQEEDEQEDEEELAAPEIETLPLFPMHGEDISGFKFDQSGGYCNSSNGWYDNGMLGARASLELSLNSYTTWSMDSR